MGTAFLHMIKVDYRYYAQSCIRQNVLWELERYRSSHVFFELQLTRYSIGGQLGTATQMILEQNPWKSQPLTPTLSEGMQYTRLSGSERYPQTWEE
jgi:hypothetical protein